MATKYVFMNHRIRQKSPRKPVIVCQWPQGTQEANSFDLVVEGKGVIGRIVYDRKGLDAVETHEVKAWVELYDVVEVRPTELRGSSVAEQRPHTAKVAGSIPAPATDPAPKPASRKLPNQPIKFL